MILIPNADHLLQKGSNFFFSSLLIAVSQIVNTVMSQSQGCRLAQLLAYQGQQQVECSDGVEQLCRNYS